jgi:hypothetical protein
MTRSRASAKKAGAAFERLIADYLNLHVSEFIDRRTRTGAKDRGDLAGLRIHGLRLVGECKDTARLAVAAALAEAEIERLNDEAIAAMIFHKRHGKAAAGEQLVTMTVCDLAAVLSGVRPGGVS